MLLNLQNVPNDENGGDESENEGGDDDEDDDDEDGDKKEGGNDDEEDDDDGNDQGCGLRCAVNRYYWIRFVDDRIREEGQFRIILRGLSEV